MDRRTFVTALAGLPMVGSVLSANEEFIAQAMAAETQPFPTKSVPQTLYASPEEILADFAARFAQCYETAGIRTYAISSNEIGGDKVGYVVMVDGAARVYTDQNWVSPSLDSRRSVEAGAEALAERCLAEGLNLFGTLELPVGVLVAERYTSVLKGLSIRFAGAAIFNAETLEVETLFRFDVIGAKA